MLYSNEGVDNSSDNAVLPKRYEKDKADLVQDKSECP